MRAERVVRRDGPGDEIQTLGLHAIIDVPAYTIPASGVVDYQRPAVANPLTEGKWVRAATIKPGARHGVHHLLTGWMEQMPANGRSSETQWRGSVGGWRAVSNCRPGHPPGCGSAGRRRRCCALRHGMRWTIA